MGKKGIHASFSEKIVLSPITPLAVGGTLDLADGQIGLFEDTSTQRGLKAVSSLSNSKGKKKFYLEVGTGINSSAGGYSGKGMRSAPFLPKDVLELTYGEAKEAKQSKVILGYDGFDTSKTINLGAGESAQLHLKLVGDPLAFYGFENGTFEMGFSFSQPSIDDCDDNCSDQPCYDVVKALKDKIDNYQLREGILLKDIINVRLLSDCSDQPESTSTADFYCITVCDQGDDQALGLVQAQVAGYQLVRTDRAGQDSTYQVVKTDGSGLPDDYVQWSANLKTNCAGTCEVGYTLVEGGFLYSVAFEDEGVDAGSTLITGTDGLSEDAGSIKTVTDDAPTGTDITNASYTGIAATATSGTGVGATFDIVVAGTDVTSVTVNNEGSGYAVGDTITIDYAEGALDGTTGSDITITITAINKTVTIVKVGQSFGVGKYNIISDAVLTDDDIAALVASDATIKVDVEYVEIEDACVLDTPITATWTACGSCDVTEKTYYIDVNDDECDNSRLTEIQSAYPSLTITEAEDPAPANCRRRYETTVLSSMVCDECYRDLYDFTAPTDFEFERWYAEEGAADGTESAACKCGLYFEGKDLEICPPKELADQIGVVNGQIQINVSGGELLGTRIGYNYNDSIFPVTRIARAFDGTGWGFQYCNGEKQSYDRFLSVNAGKTYSETWFKGNQTKLEPCEQYDTITVKLRRSKLAQGFTSEDTEYFRYIFIIPQGSRDIFDGFFNSLTSGNPDANGI